MLGRRVAISPAANSLAPTRTWYLRAKTPWLEAAALGALVPDMAERLVMDDTINEAIWSAIVSLEAMEARL